MAIQRGLGSNVKATDVECVLLTGGRSRRMGMDKAAIRVGGLRADETLCLRLSEAGYAVTVLGRVPVPGFQFLPDMEEYGGPAAALARFVPAEPYMFALACDVYRFDPAFVALARRHIEGFDAVAPCVDGIAQPLCALYRCECLASLRSAVAQGERRLRRWLAALRVHVIDDEQLREAGIDPRSVRGANVPEELERLMADEKWTP